jgi:glucose/arabinose dehydrogenase
MRSKTLLSGLLLGTAIAGPLAAQTNLEKMSSVQTTGTSYEAQFIEQGGERADQLRKHLERITLPEGFKIDLYAIVPDARHMAVGNQGTVVWVGTRKVDVYTVVDRDRDRVADEVEPFASPLDYTVPNGVCISKDGFLYTVEANRVLKYGAAEFFWENPDVDVNAIVPQGELIPAEDESYNHGARVCKIGPDNKLYISLGQPWNVPPKDKLDHYREWGIGGIIRMNQDGSDREIYTYGVRNSVGHDFHPETGELWFTDNQVDGMGDDIPPGELNHQTAMGQNFGFPWYGGGHTRTNEYMDEEPPADVVFPAVETVAHAADLGMMFYTGRMFPEKYKNAIFSAQHGSWNRTTPVGARVMVTFIDDEGNASMEPFAEGWIDENGEYNGRPVDVAQLGDGSLLVSDDLAGAIYRISYEAPEG